jgi:hypothetical protein
MPTANNLGPIVKKVACAIESYIDVVLRPDACGDHA